MDPPFNYVPPGFWYCIQCVEKKIKFGVHSVSVGVESIFDTREVVSDNEGMAYKNLHPSPQFRYYVLPTFRAHGMY